MYIKAKLSPASLKEIFLQKHIHFIKQIKSELVFLTHVQEEKRKKSALDSIPSKRETLLEKY